MHPVSVLTFGIFLAGYITARWDLVTRLYELAIFAWDHGVIVGFVYISGSLLKTNPEMLIDIRRADSRRKRLRCPLHLLSDHTGSH
jgi:phosphatidylinositol glycan class Q protein